MKFFTLCCLIGLSFAAPVSPLQKKNEQLAKTNKALLRTLKAMTETRVGHTSGTAAQAIQNDATVTIGDEVSVRGNFMQKFKSTQDQWAGSSDVIDHWLETRQSLIVEYSKLASLQPSLQSSQIELPTPDDLQGFCQHLVDYISEGHFKIYDMVMDKWKATGFVATDEINQTYTKILLTTDPLLNFADKYTDVFPEDELVDFDTDMTVIGEIIETRFAVEDHLMKLIADSLSDK